MKMYRTRCVLSLLSLYAGLAHSFSWDLVVGIQNRLEFYDGGVLTHSEEPVSRNINWLTYDPLHNRVLFRIKNNYELYTFDIATRTTQSVHLILNKYAKDATYTYDPVSETLFRLIDDKLYSFLLKPGVNEVYAGNLIDLMLPPSSKPDIIAVDSCGGYIYWTTYPNPTINRIRYNGTEEEMLISSSMTISDLTIDPQTRRMYWIEEDEFLVNFTIVSADLNGTNRRELYSEDTTAKEYEAPYDLAVSKDFIIYTEDTYRSFSWHLPKNPTCNTIIKPTQVNYIPTGYRAIASYFEFPNCNSLTSLQPNVPTDDCDSLNVSSDVSLLCVHGTRVNGESRCECAQGYIGKTCDVSVCYNYCFTGDCSVSAEGGPKCSCNAGYSGARCEVNTCQGYCLNDGVCSLNEDREPVCQCTAGYEGSRCDVTTSLIKCIQTFQKCIKNTDLKSLTEGQVMSSTCASTVF